MEMGVETQIRGCSLYRGDSTGLRTDGALPRRSGIFVVARGSRGRVVATPGIGGLSCEDICGFTAARVPLPIQILELDAHGLIDPHGADIPRHQRGSVLFGGRRDDRVVDGSANDARTRHPADKLPVRSAFE